jgi:hypothetical protein
MCSRPMRAPRQPFSTPFAPAGLERHDHDFGFSTQRAFVSHSCGSRCHLLTVKSPFLLCLTSQHAKNVTRLTRLLEIDRLGQQIQAERRLQ